MNWGYFFILENLSSVKGTNQRGQQSDTQYQSWADTSKKIKNKNGGLEVGENVLYMGSCNIRIGSEKEITFGNWKCLHIKRPGRIYKIIFILDVPYK